MWSESEKENKWQNNVLFLCQKANTKSVINVIFALCSWELLNTLDRHGQIVHTYHTRRRKQQTTWAMLVLHFFMWFFFFHSPSSSAEDLANKTQMNIDTLEDEIKFGLIHTKKSAMRVQSNSHRANNFSFVVLWWLKWAPSTARCVILPINLQTSKLREIRRPFR